jgi:hypothetical protein
MKARYRVKINSHAAAAYRKVAGSGPSGCPSPRSSPLRDTKPAVPEGRRAVSLSDRIGDRLRSHGGMMRRNGIRGLGATGLLLVACVLMGASEAREPPPRTQGQTVYVPVYSDVMSGNTSRAGKPDRWPLSVMLSIRNTDPHRELTVRSIRYYDTAGKFLRDYPAGVKLAALGTMEVFVEHQDQSGGSGANFLVVWQSDKPINAPIIETVHTHFLGTRSVAFTSRGQPLAVEDSQ